MNLMEYKRKRERGQTNEEFMDEAKKFFIEAECIVVIGVNPDGMLNTFHTQDDSLQAVGMIEIGKQQLIEDLKG